MASQGKIEGIDQDTFDNDHRKVWYDVNQTLNVAFEVSALFYDTFECLQTDPESAYLEARNAFRTKSIVVIVSGVSVLKAKEAFDCFDKDSSGTICVKELKPILRVLGQNPTDENIQTVLKQADKDDDGFLKWEEYVDLLKDNLRTQSDVEEELRDAFKYFDKNNDGTLDFEELRVALRTYGECWSKKETEELIKIIDVNQDGKVDVEEFVKYMCLTY